MAEKIKESAQRGRQGATGPSGPQGTQGLQGPPGPAMAKADVLAIVADQFDDIRHRLDLQLTRTAQVQDQLDRQHKELAAQHNEMIASHKEMVALREQLTEVQALLKTLLKVPIAP